MQVTIVLVGARPELLLVVVEYKYVTANEGYGKLELH